MMNELISYNDSLILRELGFDEACFAWYSKGQLILEHHIIFTGDQYYMRKEDCNAPTFSQAFRFFREKYKIRFIIQSSMSDLGEYFKVIFPNGEQRGVSYNTYEEAELACLIKLIEIVKKKLKFYPAKN